MFAFDIRWTKQSLYELNDIDCGTAVNLCAVYLVKPRNHLISPNPTYLKIIKQIKLLKVKYVNQINGVLMFFWKDKDYIFLN